MFSVQVVIVQFGYSFCEVN